VSTRAVASPIPLLAPVMATTFPAMPDIAILFPLTWTRVRLSIRQ
jgi:hypothetical protein